MKRISSSKLLCSFAVVSLAFLVLVSLPNGDLLMNDRSSLIRRYDQVGQCHPKHHIMFLKTHKCGSSTVQNVFLRFGLRNNLTFALTSNGNYLGHPQPFEASMIPPSLTPSSGLVDIFCIHTRLREEELKKILYDDTFWVTIVRDPVMLYESLFNFFYMDSLYNIELESFGSQSMKVLQNLSRSGGKFGRNQILFDLGSDEDISVDELSLKIKELDIIFNLVMISERMEESLILLRHQLCWSMDDIVFFTRNARLQENKRPISKNTRLKIAELNSADVILYEHFYSKHREAVLRFGERRMEEEVAALRSLNEEYYEDCVFREVSGRDERLEFKEYSGLVNSYILSNNSDENCKTLTMPELQFINLVRNKQMDLIKT